jgi:hypothetical protein
MEEFSCIDICIIIYIQPKLIHVSYSTYYTTSAENKHSKAQFTVGCHVSLLKLLNILLKAVITQLFKDILHD